MLTRRSIFLLAAFGALLAVSAVAAFAVWSNTRKEQAIIAELHERDLRIHDALAEVRSGVYLMAILARDYLLEPVPATEDYPAQFRGLQGRNQSSLRILRAALNGEEAEGALEMLSVALEAYAESTQAMFGWNAEERRLNRDAMLRKRAGRRQDILSITEHIAVLAMRTSAEQRAVLAAQEQGFRAQLGWIAGIALFLGGCIAVFTLTRMRNLEEQSERAEAELRSLSGQLRTAQEQERKALSRELHDQVGQMLTGLRMELAALSRSFNAENREAVLALDRARATVEQTLGIVRNIAMLLRPSMLDDLGLTPALTWLVKEVSRTSGIEIRREIDERVDRLPDAHCTCLYRVVQEALTNASRHSGARHVDLIVSTGGGWVQAKVTDDGRGFNAAFDKKKGLGLLGMEERVRELGGQIHVSSVPGRGTTLEILLPQPSTMEDRDDQGSDRGRPRNRPDRVTAAF